MKFAVVGTGVIGSGWITRILAHGHEVRQIPVKVLMKAC